MVHYKFNSDISNIQSITTIQQADSSSQSGETDNCLQMTFLMLPVLLPYDEAALPFSVSRQSTCPFPAVKIKSMNIITIVTEKSIDYRDKQSRYRHI